MDYRAETWVSRQGRCAVFDRQSRRSMQSSASKIDGYPIFKGGGGRGYQASATVWDWQGAQT